MTTPLNKSLIDIMKNKMHEHENKTQVCNEQILSCFHEQVIPFLIKELSLELLAWANDADGTAIKSTYESDKLFPFVSMMNAAGIQSSLVLSDMNKHKGRNIYFSTDPNIPSSNHFPVGVLKPLFDFLKAQGFKKWRVIFDNPLNPSRTSFQFFIQLDIPDKR